MWALNTLYLFIHSSRQAIWPPWYAESCLLVADNLEKKVKWSRNSSHVSVTGMKQMWKGSNKHVPMNNEVIKVPNYNRNSLCHFLSADKDHYWILPLVPQFFFPDTLPFIFWFIASRWWVILMAGGTIKL